MMLTEPCFEPLIMVCQQQLKNAVGVVVVGELQVQIK